jgi:hypothetical protein
MGARPRPSREALVEYCDRAAAALDWEIPFDHPIGGVRARAAHGAPASCAPTG